MKRMKFAALLLAGVMMLCTACSSSQPAPAKEVDLPALMEEILQTAPIDDPLTLGESDMLDFYGIKAEQMKQFAAILNINGISAQEIVLIEAADDASAEEIMNKLSNRLSSREAESKDYLPDEYEIISQCEVVRNGTQLRMIIHANAKEAITIYNKAFE